VGIAGDKIHRFSSDFREGAFDIVLPEAGGTAVFIKGTAEELHFQV